MPEINDIINRRVDSGTETARSGIQDLNDIVIGTQLALRELAESDRKQFTEFSKVLGEFRTISEAILDPKTEVTSAQAKQFNELSDRLDAEFTEVKSLAVAGTTFDQFLQQNSLEQQRNNLATRRAQESIRATQLNLREDFAEYVEENIREISTSQVGRDLASSTTGALLGPLSPLGVAANELFGLSDKVENFTSGIFDKIRERLRMQRTALDDQVEQTDTMEQLLAGTMEFQDEQTAIAKAQLEQSAEQHRESMDQLDDIADNTRDRDGGAGSGILSRLLGRGRAGLGALAGLGIRGVGAAAGFSGLANALSGASQTEGALETGLNIGQGALSSAALGASLFGAPGALAGLVIGAITTGLAELADTEFGRKLAAKVGDIAGRAFEGLRNFFFNIPEMATKAFDFITSGSLAVTLAEGIRSSFSSLTDGLVGSISGYVSNLRNSIVGGIIDRYPRIAKLLNLSLSEGPSSSLSEPISVDTRPIPSSTAVSPTVDALGLGIQTQVQSSSVAQAVAQMSTQRKSSEVRQSKDTRTASGPVGPVNYSSRFQTDDLGLIMMNSGAI